MGNRVIRPWTVKVEITEGCNRLCDFCGINAIRDGVGNYKHMDLETAYRIASDCAELCPTARYEFEGHGEPLMNPNYISIFRAFRHHLPKAQMQVTTNGLVFKRRMERKVRELLDVMDFILLDTYVPEREWLRPMVWSLSGVDVYDYFQNDVSPYRNARRKFNNAIVMMDDLMYMDGTKSTRTMHNAAGNNPMAGPTKTPLRKTCTIPYRELYVCWDGILPLCCLDFGREFYVGDVWDDSLSDLWLGPRMDAVRAVLSMRLRGFNPCSRCDRKAGSRVGLLPKYNPPTSCDVRHIIDAIEQGDYINDAEPYIHKELWGILKSEL